MKSLKVANLGAIRNELNQYKKGKKFNFEHFFGEEPPAAGPPPDPSLGE